MEDLQQQAIEAHAKRGLLEMLVVVSLFAGLCIGFVVGRAIYMPRFYLKVNDTTFEINRTLEQCRVQEAVINGEPIKSAQCIE